MRNNRKACIILVIIILIQMMIPVAYASFDVRTEKHKEIDRQQHYKTNTHQDIQEYSERTHININNSKNTIQKQTQNKSMRQKIRTGINTYRIKSKQIKQAVLNETNGDKNSKIIKLYAKIRGMYKNWFKQIKKALSRYQRIKITSTMACANSHNKQTNTVKNQTIEQVIRCDKITMCYNQEELTIISDAEKARFYAKSSQGNSKKRTQHHLTSLLKESKER